MSGRRGSSLVFADPEAYWRGQGVELICGVDEAGRGPLAGPVVAAAVILPGALHLPGLKDSKRLLPGTRETLDAQIRSRALAFAVQEVGAREIERRGILAASLKAMALAVKALAVLPEMVLVDGHQPLPLDYPQQPVIKGDDRCPSIAAASVLAKVYRDRCMAAYHRVYPQYNFAGHKGYATPEHLEAIRSWGPCPLHRRTFKGVKEWLRAGETQEA
jgi:ribonuclease HII|uniref:Ribonuclease HII n=1 Tax=Desulfobacca acetoxidans TaxID=60893 RepID=A0A7C3V138_9BACT